MGEQVDLQILKKPEQPKCQSPTGQSGDKTVLLLTEIMKKLLS